MKQTVLRIPTPKDFDFTSTVYSHGWCSLPPFSLCRASAALERVLRLSSGIVVVCTFRDGSGVIRANVISEKALVQSDRAELRGVVRRCFRLDEDLVSFHRSVASDPNRRWIATRQAGRLLRAPTVYEDLIKMICTTNCSWALTTAMVTNLCVVLGEQFDATRFAFPTPHALASSTEALLRTRVKAGYRAPFLLGLARAVDSGAIDPEQWLNSTIPAEDLYEQLRTIRGVGDYAAGNLLKLLGRYDYLGLDSWVRAQYYRLHHGGRSVKDSTIAKRYESFGRWRGLLFWLEMTRHWYTQKFPLAP